MCVHQMIQLFLLVFALGGTAGFASTPRKPAPKTCGSCQLYYDLETGIKEEVSFKEDSEALYAVLDVNPLWPFDKPIASERWGCSCKRDGYRPIWLSPNGICFWFDQQKNQGELLSNDIITELHRRACGGGAEAAGSTAERQSKPAIHHLLPRMFNHPLCFALFRCILLPPEALC